MPFSSIDAPGVLRALAQVAEDDSDLADAYFERLEVIERPDDRQQPGRHGPGLRVRREEGLAVRLVRGDRTWLAGRDALGPDELADALRRVARAMPRAAYPRPTVTAERWRQPPAAPELAQIQQSVTRALRAEDVPDEPRLTVRRHRRWVKVIGSTVTSATERESFYSLTAEAPWGRWGMLAPSPDGLAEDAATALGHLWRARAAEPPEPGSRICVLGPAAAAVLLHEAVAHALEVDHLARGGDPEAALGLRMGSALLDVFDDPSSAPESVRRHADDEGFPTRRRCLLRAGVIDEPLADAWWSRHIERLSAGAGRRGDRHQPPGPRCHHLELMPEPGRGELLDEVDEGLYFPDAARGRLDPLTGELELRFDAGRRLRGGELGEAVGPCGLRGHVAEVLSAVSAVGGTARAAGAGWCAKDGIKLPVWASAPALRLEDRELIP